MNIKVVRHWTTSYSIYGVSINQQNLHNFEYRLLVEWLELLSKILKSSININMRSRYMGHQMGQQTVGIEYDYSKKSNIIKNLKQDRREE